MPNSYKEDLKLMLGKLTNMIGTNDSTNESILSSIYNDFDDLNPVDQFVVREYVSDCINEIMEARKFDTNKNEVKAIEATQTLSANCRIVPGTDGKFYVYDEDKIVGSYDNEADARSFVNAQQKNTLVSADEEVMDENVTETVEEEPTLPDELTEEDAPVDEEVVEEDEEAPEMDELRQILEDADNILSIIDSNIKMTTDLDTVAKMIVQEDAITTKKENLEEADPSDPKIKDMINQFRDFLDQVELESIDLINKNAPGADIESEDVAEEENEKIEDIEDKIEEEMKKEEKTSIKEDTSFKDEAKAITDEKELLSKDIEEDIEVETLEKDPSIDAPDAEDINEVLGDFEDEEFEFIDEDEEVLDETTESPVETIEEIDNLIDKLMDLIIDEVENEEVAEEAEEIKEEIQENLDKVEASVEELPVEDEEFEDIVFDEEEAPVEDIEELPVEEELEEELTEEELEDEEEKAVEEAKVLNEISEEDLHKVDFPGGTGADEGAIYASKVKKNNKDKKEEKKEQPKKNKKNK